MNSLRIPLRRKWTMLLLASVSVSLITSNGRAQGPPVSRSPDLASLIPDLFDRTVVLFSAGHQAHFVDSSSLLRDSGLQINSSIVGQVSTFPLGSSSGGFTYNYNEELGIFERTSDSFGSIFAERAVTIGRGKWNFGFNLFQVDYDAIDGLDLRGDDLNFSLTHLDTNDDGTTVESFFEGDLVLAEASLNLATETFVVFGNYGVTNRLDIAVAVPFVKVDLEASLQTGIARLASEGFSEPAFHRFPDGSDRQTFVDRGSASGVGDVLIRGKYILARNDYAGVAAALELRLPTGDEDELLGTGALQSKLFFIGSANFGAFSPHVNVGYAIASGSSDLVGELPDEISFTAGFSVALHPRVTFAADAVWRTLRDANQLRTEETTHLFKRWNGTKIESIDREILGTATNDLNLLVGAVGFKVNVAGDVLVTVNLAFSLSDDGLQDDDVIPLIGIDYSF